MFLFEQKHTTLVDSNYCCHHVTILNNPLRVAFGSINRSESYDEETNFPVVHSDVGSTWYF